MIDKNKIIAHRGIHDSYIVENTLLAFLKAVEKGYAIELDVRLLKDDVIVVYHDFNLQRLTGINKLIESCTLKDISNIKINDKYYIPTLEQVLKLVEGKVPIYIDVKGNIGNYKLEEILLDLLKEYRGEIFIQSFNPRTIRWFRKKESRYKYGLITFNYPQYNILKKLFIHLQVDFIVCYIKNISDKRLQKIRKNKRLIGWTIKKYSEIVKYQPFVDKFICENI